MINEKQYLELCEACNSILLLPDTTIERVAIPWLHVIREHPIVLANYNNLFVSEKGFKKIFSQIKNVLIRKAIWFRQVLLAIKSNGKPWFGKDKLPDKVDYLFISHLLNPNQYSQKEDFYFGSIPNDLINNNRSVVIASISHFNNQYRFFQDKFVKGTVPRLFFSSSLNLKDEINIRKSAKRQSLILKKLANEENRVLYKRILTKASKEAMSGGTQRILRLNHQIQELVTRLQPKAIVVTYEGHSFERITFASARKILPMIKCVSYQHTGVFRLSNAIRQKYSAQYNPDIILTSGFDAKSELDNTHALKDIPISILGSPRGIVEYVETLETKTCKEGYACLVIPEGFNSECMHLFRFSLICAIEKPEIKFIWRLHPSITFEKLRAMNPELRNLPKNILLSSDTIENDINRCSWVLYRGTTAIYKSISKGLRPFYLSIPGEITIDPLYEMKKWRVVVSSPQDMLLCITEDIAQNMDEKKIYSHLTQEICVKRFSKINLNVLNNVIK